MSLLRDAVAVTQIQKTFKVLVISFSIYSVVPILLLGLFIIYGKGSIQTLLLLFLISYLTFLIRFATTRDPPSAIGYSIHIVVFAVCLAFMIVKLDMVLGWAVIFSALTFIAWVMSLFAVRTARIYRTQQANRPADAA